MQFQVSQWVILAGAACIWRIIYAYWTPLVNRYLVPPGDDPAFHIARVSEFLGGQWQLFTTGGYPLGSHLGVAILAKYLHLDALNAVRLIAPVLLVVPIFPLYFLGRRLFQTPAAGAFAALTWSFLALAPVRAFGDGNYPNLIGGSLLVPLAVFSAITIVERPNWLPVLSGWFFLFAIALTHHLSLVYLAIALVPLLLSVTIQRLLNKETRRATLLGLVLAGAAIFLFSWSLWQSYRPLLSTFYTTLLSQGTLAKFFGLQSTPLSWDKLIEVHNPLFVMLGLAGLLVLFVSRLPWTYKVLFAGWVGLLWLFSMTSLFGLPERFVRELAIPLSLLAGYFLAVLITGTRQWHWRALLLTIFLSIFFLDWLESFARPFALPDPYKPLIRLQHEEEFAVDFLRDPRWMGSTILANNSNPYLPFLVPERVVIASHPDEVTAALSRGPISLLYIGSRPPLTPETVYPFYTNFGITREHLLAIPGKERLRRLPSGTEIYRLKK